MSDNNVSKRLAKNTAFMYVRMLFLMCISFYTSRIILDQLGVSDYGIYNVVGSVVAMFASLRTLFATSTQRFLNYEMGANSGKQNLVFSISTIVNLIIGLLFIAVVECVGLWFLQYKFNADPSRFFAAHCVLHLSVVSAFISIMTTPYDAVIIAHEKMDFYAYMSIIEALLKLGVVFLLMYSPFDKLIYYSLLLLLVSIIVRTINSIYCKRHFEESRFSFLWDKEYFKQMFSFAGWNFFGNASYSITQNVINMILNVFGGPAINAARGLVYQVHGALSQFTSNINIVIAPFCVKSHAEGNDDKLFRMMYLSSKILFTVQLMVVIPCVYLAQWLLELWLKQVPDYTVVFLQLVLVYSLLRSIHGPIDTLFKAFGKLRTYQLCEGIILALPMLFVYLALRAGLDYTWSFIVIIIFDVINSSVIIPIAKRQTGLPVTKYIYNVIAPCAVLAALNITLYLLIRNQVSSFITMSLLCIPVMLCSLLLMWLSGLDTFEKTQIKNLVIKRVKK